MTSFPGFAPGPLVHLVFGYKAGIGNAPPTQVFCPHFGPTIFANTTQTLGESEFAACLKSDEILDESVDNF